MQKQFFSVFTKFCVNHPYSDNFEIITHHNYYYFYCYIFFFQEELDKFKLPHNEVDQKDPDIAITKVEKEVINENINAIRSRQLSQNEIKSYSLEKKIKILLFNGKLFFVILDFEHLYTNFISVLLFLKYGKLCFTICLYCTLVFTINFTLPDVLVSGLTKTVPVSWSQPVTQMVVNFVPIIRGQKNIIHSP